MSKIFHWSSTFAPVMVVVSWVNSVSADVKLIGTAEIPGTATDRSGLTELFNESIPANRLGGISALEHVADNEYLGLSDRGPLDGAIPFACRVHKLKIIVSPGHSTPITAEVVATIRLTDESGQQLVGAKAALDSTHPERSLRFDPEGLRVRGSRWFVSDEYGPHVREFNAIGTLVKRFKLPARFGIAQPADDPQVENTRNTTGRQANGGLEGLAISPDGKRLFAMMQRPLLQDSRLGDQDKRIGRFNRLIEINIANGAKREFVYPLDKSSHGLSEILAVNDHEFLVIERDGLAGLDAACKKVFRIDVRDATDVSRVEALPADELPSHISPVRKSLFLDLLDPRHGLGGEHSPEKVEGLTFGPTLPDGRRLLLVAVDNDFRADQPILIHAFSVDIDD